MSGECPLVPYEFNCGYEAEGVGEDVLGGGGWGGGGGIGEVGVVVVVVEGDG